MQRQKYAVLLFNAVRETLETMAFAEVVPCSLMLGGKEISDEFVANTSPNDSRFGWGDENNNDSAADDSAPDDFVDDWGAAPNIPAPPSDSGFDAPWGEAPAATADNQWGAATQAPVDAPDPWGEAAGSVERGMTGINISGKDINFEQLVDKQEDWVWSCMRVNSTDVHSVWLIVSKSLALQLAESMYAGENIQLDSPIIRDLVAELTNVLGGKLMLLLEELGGKFTLAVPEIGIGMPKMPERLSLETVLCKVLVDSEYPVMTSICFNEA